ncbi:MAG: hypothetical protein U1F25_10970 [Rubrivivax sp.]
MPYFVFAEFGNEEVLGFLRKLRNAFASEVLSPIHVTLRGPYTEPPSLNDLEAMAARLPGYGVKIQGAGAFSTPKGFAVFLRAECTVFPQLWDKPDYKVPLARIEPHITMFESDDRVAAIQVRDFLKKQDILIHTYSVHLSLYESRSQQLALFELPKAVPGGRAIARDLWRMPPDILDRAAELGERLRLRTSSAG